MSTGISGTQSPPVEATGGQVPMGASSVDNPGPVEAVPDSEQRKAYFGNDESTAKQQTSSDSEKSQKLMGQSMSQEHEKLD
ncbi:hypothetical protein HGRIS_011729 [Hohenbuehelia grisea]|uniref:Uncharacterized protein n=1 Tax=Hohenbuehelia grisea TaxID=104357 RepID=A0ABR3JWU4_9AGAR